MSILDCDCDDEVLETIPVDDCILEFLKDGIWIFQELDDPNNKFVDGVNPIDAKTSWTGLPDAVDKTKVAVTVELEEVDFPEPGIITDGQNLDGADNNIASEPQTVTAIWRNPTPKQFAAIEKLGCKRRLTLYRVDNNGKFGCREITTGEYAGIKISPRTFNAPDPFKGPNRGDQAKTRITLVLPAGWFKTFAVVAPEAGFDPLVDIKPTP